MQEQGTSQRGESSQHNRDQVNLAPDSQALQTAKEESESVGVSSYLCGALTSDQDQDHLLPVCRGEMESARSLCDYFQGSQSSTMGSPKPLNAGRDKDKVLMHGVLHIKIIKCHDLPNVDGIRGMAALGKYAPAFVSKNVSDPYVTVHTDYARIAKTRVIFDDLNPIFDETFYIPMAHYCSGLAFKVKDLDIGKTAEFLGKTFLPATELVRFDADRNALRVGVHRIVALEGHVLKRGHGMMEYFVEYVPAAMLKNSLTVPGVYFQPQYDNDCKLYVNADDGVDMAPFVTYGGLNDDDRVWTPPRLWRDMYDAICDAKHFIYITGWAVDCKQSLLRGKEWEEVEAAGGYSPVIGELLKQKAEEGVVVNMLVWDDATSNPGMLHPLGFMGTHDEESRMFFKDSKVTFRLAPMQGEKQQFLKEKITKFVMFTHHQKICVLDAKTEDGAPQAREPLAFVGGIDLTDGRWDNSKHPLFRTLQTDHKGDCYNGCFPVDVDEVGPRQPWHDIHACVRGPGAYDVIANFRERWFKQASDAAGELIDLQACGMGQPLHHPSRESWCTQVLRSIDERTCVFDKGHIASFMEDDINDIPGVEYMGDDFAVKKKKKGGVKGLMKKAQASMEGETASERSRSFVTNNAQAFKYCHDLSKKKGRKIDSSMHEGWVHHIRRAEHTIYIESQYFLGASHMWPSSQGTKCGNLIPAEITLKIIDKIEKGERFAAYILIPLWPEGIPETASVQAILRWQRFTMESMYKRISLALRKAGRGSESPRDYLNFYALATRETADGSTAVKHPTQVVEDTLSNTRRHQVYVHSKMLIVDDAVTIIGSANINQRSMDGARDSEIALASFQPAHLPTRNGVPCGEVHGFRMHCWATIANTMEDIFKHPSSLDCVHRMNSIAEQNWQKFIAPNTTEMDSHVIPYPIKIDEEGCVTAKGEVNGMFPDTRATILGSMARTLPEILTT
jgi:phospholipase D1/2